MFHHLFQKPWKEYPVGARSPCHTCGTGAWQRSQACSVSCGDLEDFKGLFLKLEEKPIEATCQLNPAESSPFFFVLKRPADNGTFGKRPFFIRPSTSRKLSGMAWNVDPMLKLGAWNIFYPPIPPKKIRWRAICLIVFIVFPLKMVINIHLNLNK